LGTGDSVLSFLLSLSLFLFPSFLHILRHVGRPTLDLHQGCSVTRVRAYSHECFVSSAHARTRGESIANSNSGRIGPRPRAKGRGFAIERMRHSFCRVEYYAVLYTTIPPKGETDTSEQSLRPAGARDAKGD
jgi:hypothetical protein